MTSSTCRTVSTPTPRLAENPWRWCQSSTSFRPLNQTPWKTLQLVQMWEEANTTDDIRMTMPELLPWIGLVWTTAETLPWKEPPLLKHRLRLRYLGSPQNGMEWNGLSFAAVTAVLTSFTVPYSFLPSSNQNFTFWTNRICLLLANSVCSVRLLIDC